MPSATTRSNLVIRTKAPASPVLSQNSSSSPRSLHRQSPPLEAVHSPVRISSPIPIKQSHSPHLRPTQHPHAHLPYKPPRPRPHMAQKPTIAVVNASGRQAASFIRVASAVGYKVRAQLRSQEGIVANEISGLANVKIFVGDLYTPSSPVIARTDEPRENGAVKNGTGLNHTLINELFHGAQLAFINTTFWGDEVAIGCALADAAKRANVQHYIYSSMPNHHLLNPEWPSLPLWSAKTEVESYIRNIGLPATFVYTGIYNNNFTSLPYPLFCMALQPDGSFLWQAPFHPDAKLPWLDAEHDVGPAVIQLFKDGPQKWLNQRIALAYEVLSPVEACKVFAKGVGRPVKYAQGPIEISVPIPRGYRDQLVALEKLYEIGKDDPKKQPEYFGSRELENTCPKEAMMLWEGHRGLEEYAREVFPLEEQANGLRWMEEDLDGELVTQDTEDADGDGSDDESDVLTMTATRKDEEWLA